MFYWNLRYSRINRVFFENRQNSQPWFSLDDTPVRPWNADNVTANDQNYLNRSRERWKQLKMLDQSSHSSTHCPIIEELDETNQSLISPNESLEPELAAPEMPKLPESR